MTATQKATYRVLVWDRDYHSITDVEYIEFSSEEEAKKYAKDHSWTGEDYIVSRAWDSKGMAP